MRPTINRCINNIVSLIPSREQYNTQQQPLTHKYYLLSITFWWEANRLCDQRYMVKTLATSREILSFPGKGLGREHLVTNVVAQRPVNHTSAANKWQVTPDNLPNCARGKGVNRKFHFAKYTTTFESKFLELENFCQKYEKFFRVSVS